MKNEIRMIQTMHYVKPVLENNLRITTMIKNEYATDVTRKAILENIVIEKIFGKEGYNLTFKPNFYKDGNPVYTCDKILKLKNGNLIMRYRKCVDGKYPDSQPQFIYASKKDKEKLKMTLRLKKALKEGGFETN